MTTTTTIQKLIIRNSSCDQGGGSLGAYECGAYKTFVNHKIKFDIIAGMSIGQLIFTIMIR